jgi:hypothetical protein
MGQIVKGTITGSGSHCRAALLTPYDDLSGAMFRVGCVVRGSGDLGCLTIPCANTGGKQLEGGKDKSGLATGPQNLVDGIRDALDLVVGEAAEDREVEVARSIMPEISSKAALIVDKARSSRAKSLSHFLAV